MSTLTKRAGQLVKHKEKGGLYYICGTGNLKYDGTWFDSITYVGKNNTHTGPLHTRTVADFEEHFEDAEDDESDV